MTWLFSVDHHVWSVYLPSALIYVGCSTCSSLDMMWDHVFHDVTLFPCIIWLPSTCSKYPVVFIKIQQIQCGGHVMPSFADLYLHLRNSKNYINIGEVTGCSRISRLISSGNACSWTSPAGDCVRTLLLRSSGNHTHLQYGRCIRQLLVYIGMISSFYLRKWRCGRGRLTLRRWANAGNALIYSTMRWKTLLLWWIWTGWTMTICVGDWLRRSSSARQRQDVSFFIDIKIPTV